MNGRQIRYSADELAWIKAYAGDTPRRDMHALFVQVWNRPDVTHNHLKALCIRKGWKSSNTGHFPKGNIPHHAGKSFNHPGSKATQFKPGHGRSGHAITLYKPIGTERVTHDGYVERKINDGPEPAKRWRGVHRINYEATHGPVPPGHRLKCLDGNKANTAAGNWKAIPYALALRLDGKYGRGFNAAPPELKPLILATTELEHAARQAKKDARNG